MFNSLSVQKPTKWPVVVAMNYSLRLAKNIILLRDQSFRDTFWRLELDHSNESTACTILVILR